VDADRATANRCGLAVVAALLAVVASANNGSAQTANGPYRPIFGGAGDMATARQNLDVTLNVTEGRDSNSAAVAEAGVLGSATLQGNGFYTEIGPQVNAGWRGARMQFSATGASNVRDYSDPHEVFVTSHVARVALAAQLTRRTRVTIDQGVTYAPTFQYGLTSGGGTQSVGPVNGDALSTSNTVLNSEPSYSYATRASLAHSFTGRTDVSFNADFQYTDFVRHDPGYPDLHAYHAGGRLTHALNRNLKLHAGYTFGHSQYTGLVQPTVEHDIDVGVDYSRPLSRSRKTTVGFSLGSTLLTGPLLGTQPILEQQYRFIGNAMFTRQISRTWSAQGTFGRNLSYLQGLPEPVFTNAFTAATSGFLNRRTDLLLSAAYSAAQPSPGGDASPFTTYTGDVRLRVALTTMLAASAEYFYYFYNFNRNLPLPPGVPPELTRSGVRVGVTLWVPVRRR
jgi:hypothetical protein